MEIGIWGDSITYGESDDEALGWVGRLRRSFSVDEDVQVYNRGICGNTSADVLKRFKIEADSLEPTIIVFAVGINDSKHPLGESTNKVSLEQYQQNMRSLVTQALGYTKNVFIVGATQVDEEVIAQRKDSSRFFNTEIEKYNAVLKQLAAENNLVYIDVFGAMDIKSDLHDGLHPNAGGYEKLSQKIKPLLNL